MRGNSVSASNFQLLKSLTVNDVMKSLDFDKICSIDPQQRPKSENYNPNSLNINQIINNNNNNNNKKFNQETQQVKNEEFQEFSEIKSYASRAGKYDNEGDALLAANDLNTVTQLYYQGKTQGLQNNEKKIIEDSIESKEKVELQVHKLENQVGNAVGTYQEKVELKQNMEKLNQMVRGVMEQNAVQRIACIQEQTNPGKRENIQKEKEKEAEVVRQKMSILVNQLGNNPSAADANEKIIKQIQELYQKVQEQQQVIKQLKQDMLDGGVLEKAEVNRGFRRIEESGGELYMYCKTFYWTTINIIMAYRNLGTGLVQGNFKSDLNKYLSKNSDLICYCVNKGVKYTSTYDTIKTGVKVAKGMLKAIPFVGRLVCAVDEIVNVVIEASCNALDKVELLKFESRVNAINKVIMSKFGLEDQISIVIAKLAIKFTDLKKKQILDPTIKSPFQTQSWFEQKVKAAKSMACEQVEINDQSSRGVYLALRDVSLFISFICTNWQEIVYSNDQNIEALVENVIENNRLEKLVKEKTVLIPKNKKNKPLKESKKKCTIF